MQPIHGESAIVRQHFDFIDKLGRRLRDDAYGLHETPLGELSEQFPGLQQLLDSMVSASPTPRKVKERTIEDWNPFAQRVLLSDETPLESSLFEGEFSLLSTYVQTFIEWAHEAIHILAVEPWLVGRCAISSQAEFERWNLAAEALAFWYADIVVTRTIRTTVPEAELVYSRQSVSNTCFHPEQAFRRIGLHEALELLPLYIAGFLGDETPLATHAHPYARALSRRLYEFYEGTTSTLASLYTVLQEFGFFAQYYPRFCAIDGLPSLFDCARFDEPWDLFDYHVELGRTILPSLQTCTPDQVRRVQVRRHLQTRAYYAWCLRCALNERWVFGNSELNTDALGVHIDTYLDTIERLLRGPVVEGRVHDAVEQVQVLDQSFEHNVRGPLAHGDAYVKYRYRLYPYFSPTGGIVGLADQRSNYTPSEMMEIVAFVMRSCACEPTLVSRLNRFYECAARTHDIASTRVAFNDFMTHPLALAVWSVRLDLVDPVHNQFREFLFEYT